MWAELGIMGIPAGHTLSLNPSSRGAATANIQSFASTGRLRSSDESLINGTADIAATAPSYEQLAHPDWVSRFNG